MVAAEADVVLLQFDGPERSVQLPVLVLAVRVDGSHKAHQQNNQNDDDGEDDDVELSPGDVGQCRRAVLGRWAWEGRLYHWLARRGIEGQVSSFRMFGVAFLACLAMNPGCVVEAINAFARIRLADSRRKSRVNIPVALAFQADAVRAVVALVAFVAEGSDVARTTLDTAWSLLTRL
ncbi:hypothetical protein E2320_006514 [Naja naja]|nr:hypothetical protein E2320_006514 [Naja naja]